MTRSKYCTPIGWDLDIAAAVAGTLLCKQNTERKIPLKGGKLLVLDFEGISEFILSIFQHK